MRRLTGAALALTAASSLYAQTAAPDLSTATPVAGNWSFAETSNGSEATFGTGSALPQLTIHCTKATRRISISGAPSGAAPFLKVWAIPLSPPSPAS